MTKKTRDWPLAEAKAKFSELVGLAEENGPQYVTKRGKRTAVLVPIDEFERMEGKKPVYTIKDWLLDPLGRGGMTIPDRKSYRWRKPPKL